MLSQAFAKNRGKWVLYDENGKLLIIVGKYDFYTRTGGGVESGEDKHRH